MLLTLFKSNEICRTVLPEKIAGQYRVEHTTVSGELETLIVAEAYENNWLLKCGVNADFILGNGGKTKEILVNGGGRALLVISRTGEKAVVMAEEILPETMCFRKAVLSSSCRFRIGNQNGCDVFLSGIKGINVFVEIDYNDKTGFSVIGFSGSELYINKVAIDYRKINLGDMISVSNYRFVFGKGFIAYDKENTVLIQNKTLFGSFLIPENYGEVDYHFDETYKPNLFYCSPRFKKETLTREFEVEYPPNQESGNNIPMIMSIGPSFTMGVASAVTAGFTVTNQLSNGGDITNSMPSIIMASSMLATSLLWPLVTKNYENHKRKKRERKRKEKYAEYLRERRELIKQITEAQRAVIFDNNPSLECLSERVLKRDRALWERMNGQSDFLNLAVGNGNVPIDAGFKLPVDRFSLDEDPMRKEADKFIAEITDLENVPVEISLEDSRVVGIIGERKPVISYAKGWILQLAALYSYEDLGIIFLYDSSEEEDWGFYRWLPHVNSTESDIRLIASTSDELKTISVEVEKIRLSDSGRHYVIISAGRKLYRKADFISRILKEDDERFSVIMLHDLMNYLPKECSTVFEIKGDTAQIYKMHSENNTAESVAIFDTSTIDMEKIAVALSNIKLAQNVENYVLPSTYTFLEMFDVTKVEHLNCLQRWKENNPIVSLKAPIGVDSHGDLCMLDLHQKAHGPHGLIAGMTGSGKSEFIMTMILSLAVCYHPDEVAFILIDYKGGGMAHAFGTIPHTAGIITNLDGAAINRSLVSIQSELKRRQRIFGETEQLLGTSNIDIYKYQKLYREGVVSEPLPHLMIISDEFAELKMQQSEFMDQLVSAARIGRSLGVHLVLATQKPSGVVSDQIWSNSKFKICLKVQDKEDSNEMIKRPDAASLVEVGRFYLQVGYNELFELGQSAWCGPTYDPDATQKKSDTKHIRVIDRIGRTVAQADDTKKTEKEKSALDLKQIDAITAYISKLGEEENIKARSLWLPPVPEVIILDDIVKKYGYKRPEKTVGFAVGECDIPEKQQQDILTFDLEESGNIAVFGSSGSGKTTFLTTAIYNVAKNYKPTECNFYVLDFNAQTMKSFSKLNHVGEVMLPDDKEKISRFFSWLMYEFRRRRKILSDFDGGYYGYVSKGNTMPWITVMIHNFGAFSETYHEYDDVVITLTREALKCGISFILTAITTNAVKLRVIQNFKTQLTLRLNDDSYSFVFSGIRKMKPSNCKGRGLALHDGVNEFQTAYIAQPDEINNSIYALCDEANEKYGMSRAHRIAVLPDVYRPSEAADYIPEAPDGTLPVAYDAENVEPLFYKHTRPIILAMSKNEAVPSFMQGMAELLSSDNKNRVMVFDGANPFKTDSNALYERYSDKDEFFTSLRKSSEDKTVHTYAVITSLGSFIKSLEFPYTEHFRILISDALKNGNITLMFSARTTDTSLFSNEDWYKDIMNAGNYIWLGNGLKDSYQMNRSNDITDVNMGNDGGYIVEKAYARRVKFISGEVYKNE